jgi:hypothetical protein
LIGVFAGHFGPNWSKLLWRVSAPLTVAWRERLRETFALCCVHPSSNQQRRDIRTGCRKQSLSG